MDVAACPNCRQPWIDVATLEAVHEPVVRKDKDVYTNLGDLQGQRRNRDTSNNESNEYEYNRHYSSSRRGCRY